MNLLIFLIAVAGTVASAVSGWAMMGIEGSKHDLSNMAWSNGDTCGACHSPHNEAPPKAAPLWNASADLSRTFGTAIGDPVAPGSGTRTCIRCHDGTIALDTIAGVNRDRFVNKQHLGLFKTGHGRTDHPVGMKYPQFDKGFRPMNSVLAQGGVHLPDGRVECISCHDPHNQSGIPGMLVMSNYRSSLCLTCHRK
jgi:predicted CXXCH cytochrome family protein